MATPIIGYAIAGAGLIHGKGTPFRDVYGRVPKYFYVYADNFFSENRQAAAPVFEIKSGRHITTPAEVQNILARNNAAAQEAGARKKGERVTLDFYLFSDVKPLAEFRGTSTVNGIAYDKNAVSAPVTVSPQADYTSADSPVAHPSSPVVTSPNVAPQSEPATAGAGLDIVARFANTLGTSTRNIYIALGVLAVVLFRREIFGLVRKVVK